MSVVGLFVQARPNIGGLLFDATLEESTELQTDITEFTIESGVRGNDHAVQRPLEITMTVGVSDNVSRAETARATGTAQPAGRSAIGIAAGGIASTLPSEAAVAAGLGASVVNAARTAGQALTRSQNALEDLRALQRANVIIDVVTLKQTYLGCMIQNTRQRTTKENEASLEVVVTLRQLLVARRAAALPEVPAPNDSAETQGQRPRNLGLVSTQ